MSRRTFAALGAVVLGASLLTAPTLAGAAPPADRGAPATTPVPVSESGSYVVVMEGEPLVVTHGRDNLRDDAARQRAAQLRAQHAAAANAVGAQPVNDYTVALNGFSAILDHDEAEQLAARKDVRLVLPDEMRQATTDASGDFLGLTAPAGAYATGLDGEGVVVGVIDTGIWPEHPSFADDGSYDNPGINLSKDRPTCEFGNDEHVTLRDGERVEDADFTCNHKLLGARQMLDTYRSLIGAEATEFDSARDDDGHGTHTASTAAGNADVPATVNGHDLGPVTGIAPRASIVAYKGLGALGGFTSDLTAAIDQAVADGVDVINYSIGGGATLLGADDIAFLYAADAGVHVATSAGNDGPGDATIGGPASVPWLTSVGASTQTRFFEGTVVLGDETRLTGASLTGTVGESPLVDAEDATADGDDLCVPGTLDPAVVEGAIVLCRRGAIARVDKSLAVLQAGGVGMVMYENSDAGDRFTDNHHVPSVHVDNTEGLIIKAYIDSVGSTGGSGGGKGKGSGKGKGGGSKPPSEPATTATAAIVNTGTEGTFDPAPSMTSFSSRGPDPVAMDVIKPDVTAPGMQILAGASPYADPNGNDFQSIAGTSMSSPHVAGLFALLDQAHPHWSPATAKSALMTSSHQDVVDNDRMTPATPFAMGAGHVDPGSPSQLGSAFEPGIAYDAGFDDYLGFLCDAAADALSASTCASLAANGVPTTTTDLNLPSIGASSVPGVLTVSRRVTGTSNGPARTWTADVDAPEGFDVTVSPSQFSIRKGQTVEYTVTIQNTSAPVGAWRHGSLTWTSGAASAYSPVSVRGSALDVPDTVAGSGETGSVAIDVAYGYTGAYTPTGHGLSAARVERDDVPFDQDQTFQPSDVGTGAVAYEVTVADSALLRIAIPPDAVVDPDVDIDLFVADSSGTIVGQSTNGGTDELVDLLLPADDTYTVYVHGWQTVTPTTPVTTYIWDVPLSPGPTLEASDPGDAVLGQTATVEAGWTGATDGEWHLGAVSHADASGLVGLTLVEVDNR